MMDAVVQRIAAAHPSLFFPESGCWHDCPPGWEALVTELCARLVADHPEAKCVQCKSKFGGLRFYLNDKASEASRALAHEYETRSASICETCGKPAQQASGKRGWISTACAEHATGKLPDD